MGRMVFFGVVLLAVGASAEPDKSMVVAQWIWNIVSGLAMLWVALKVREFGDLKNDAAKKTEQMVDLKILGLKTALEDLTQRLDDGDGSIDKLSDRDHKLELMLNSQTGDLQKWMAEKFATKEDVRLLATQVAGLGDSVSEISRAQAHAEGFNEGMARKGTKSA